MKSRLLYFFTIIFFYCNISISEIYNFEVSKIDIKNNGKIINAYDGKIFSEKKNIEIYAEKFLYFKELDLLEAINGNAYIKKEKINIKFNLFKLNNKNILTASDGIQIEDLKNSIDIKGEKIILDRNKNILTASDGIQIEDLKNSIDIKGKKIILDRNKNILMSNYNSTLKDKFENTIEAKKFKYHLEREVIFINDALIHDFENNKLKIESAVVNLKSNSLNGKKIKINLNNKFLNSDNEPRLMGESLNYKEDITEISNGLFTVCKETGSCPPWELSANKITHNKKKKSISYDDVWLKIYDTPVVYFPKFFHPDPSVKRQSGFLIPSFKTSPNNNTFLSIPYYKVLDDSSDLTFTPRLYAKDQLLIQNEYRKINKNSKFITDFSLLKDKGDKIESHLFFNLNKNLNLENFSNSSLKLKLENSSNDTYIKANRLNSPIINNYELLENSLNIDMSSEDLKVSTDFIIYKNLNKTSNDAYEYIFPKVNLSKKLKNNTKLKGNFNFKSENFIHNYDTNIIERVNTNDLIFDSNPLITKNGFYNNYEFILKNSNTSSQKSKLHKEGEEFYYSGLIQFNSSYPLIKENKKNRKLLKPKLSLQYGPGHTKDISNETFKLDVNNIFNLERISSNETLESGLSLTYGADYILTEKNNKNEILSLKFANNLRLKDNDDLEKNNQLGAKTSNFFGEIKYSPLTFLTTRYNLSTKNNLTDINYQNLITEVKFNNFSTTLDYLRQDEDKNSYFLNKTSYNFDNEKSLNFSTRKNLKTDLTEFYNLMYQYKNDCLAASIEYNKEYYNDRDIKPSESVFLKLTIIPFGSTSSPNIKN